MASESKIDGDSNMRLPQYLTKDHIKQAIAEVDRLGESAIPARRRLRRYALCHKGLNYPPKFTICLAHKFWDGTEFPNVFGGGNEANGFLRARGFRIFNTETQKEIGIEPAKEGDDPEFEEGTRFYKRHLSIERNARIGSTAKQLRLKTDPNLKCDACGFSFRRTYGPIGEGFIEAHHTVPLGELTGPRKFKLGEIALLCANCHRMVHRSYPLLSVNQLREKLNPRAKTHQNK